jgi:hypothetical protein
MRHKSLPGRVTLCGAQYRADRVTLEDTEVTCQECKAVLYDPLMRVMTNLCPGENRSCQALEVSTARALIKAVEVYVLMGNDNPIAVCTDRAQADLWQSQLHDPGALDLRAPGLVGMAESWHPSYYVRVYPVPLNPQSPMKRAIEPHPQNPNYPKTWPRPKSLCGCGHTGDGPNSQHDVTEFGVDGHGPCAVPDCTCLKFSWARWTPEYRAAMDFLKAQRTS